MVCGRAEDRHGPDSPGTSHQQQSACRICCAVVALLFVGCKDWREAVVPGLAVPEPSQRTITAEAITIPQHPEFRLLPRAEYHTKAWAIAVDDDVDDDWAAIAPLDVSLAWGPVAHPSVLRHISFHLKRRYVSLRWDGQMPLSKDEVMHHASNHHLIPSSAEVMLSLEQIRPGDFVQLDGLLVDLRGPPGLMRTSLSRTDIGNGACEVLYVQFVEVSRPD